MIKGIIDRFEDDYVVVEIEGITKDFLKVNFPTEAKPGDVVYIEGTKISINKHETKKLENEIQELMDEVWED